jgi:hypothetical protein
LDEGRFGLALPLQFPFRPVSEAPLELLVAPFLLIRNEFIVQDPPQELTVEERFEPVRGHGI